jgi:hypothetical protein
MKIVCEFENRQEHDSYCMDISGTDKLLEQVAHLNERLFKSESIIKELQEKNVKALITTDTITTSYDTEHVIAVADELINKVNMFYVKNNKATSYQNMYSYVRKYISKTYEGLNGEMQSALYKNAYKYARDSKKIIYDDEKKLIYPYNKVPGMVE